MPNHPASVLLRNEGTTDFTDSYDGHRFIIPAGGELNVPFDAMCLWLGHPDANNFDPRNRVRVEEYARLRLKYGVDARALESSWAGQGSLDPDELFHSMKPALKAYDYDGSPIITVCDDPDGNTLTPTVDADSDLQSQILARMQNMERELTNLRAQHAQQLRTQQALNDAIPIAEDAAPPSPTRADIPGTVEPNPLDDANPTPPTTAPRAPARTEVGEDAPTSVRVGGVRH